MHKILSRVSKTYRRHLRARNVYDRICYKVINLDIIILSKMFKLNFGMKSKINDKKKDPLFPIS